MNIKDTPNSLRTGAGIAAKKPRSSNLELYRIICMLMIVAHHFVVNSGAFKTGGPILSDPMSVNSIYLTLFGAWGKTGINCFLMITGYFMCTSKITLRKFVKLIAQVYFYELIIYTILLIAGYETVSINRARFLVIPFWGFKDNFVSCFMGFWLTIPFLNILVRNMTKRQHELLLVLLLGFYTILGSIPTFYIGMEYIVWFGVIYLIASYIRLYPNKLFVKRSFWGYMTLVNVIIAMISIVGMQYVFGRWSFFVSDSNRFFAVTTAILSFLWFKNLNIRYSKVINAFGAGTFGVLLIHANSNAMRTWLWKDTVDVVGHYSLPIGSLIVYSIGVVFAVFVICNLIDQLRIYTIETWFFKWYDSKIATKAEGFIERIIR